MLETPLDVARQDAARATAHAQHWQVRYEATEQLRQMAQASSVTWALRAMELERALREAAGVLEAEGLTRSAAAAREALERGAQGLDSKG